MADALIDVMRLMVAKLVRMNKWGGAHTEIIHLSNGLPRHYVSSKKGKKVIQQAIKTLIQSEFLLTKQSTGSFMFR